MKNNWILGFGPKQSVDVVSIYHGRKIGMESGEVTSLLWGSVEFEIPIRHPSGVIKLEEEFEIEIVFWSLDT